MPSANRTATPVATDVDVAVANLIRFLETGTIPDGLFAASRWHLRDAVRTGTECAYEPGDDGWEWVLDG